MTCCSKRVSCGGSFGRTAAGFDEDFPESGENPQAGLRRSTEMSSSLDPTRSLKYLGWAAKTRYGPSYGRVRGGPRCPLRRKTNSTPSSAVGMVGDEEEDECSTCHAGLVYAKPPKSARRARARSDGESDPGTGTWPGSRRSAPVRTAAGDVWVSSLTTERRPRSAMGSFSTHSSGSPLAMRADLRVCLLYTSPSPRD